MKRREENPFKFGTIVDGDFFTDRRNELAYVKSVFHSSNHLVIISPRRYGKTSLVLKAANEIGRPFIKIDFNSVTGRDDLAKTLLRRIYTLSPSERFKRLIRNFRFTPTISVNPLSNGVDFEFVPSADESVILEDAFSLLDKISSPENRVIVIFDEFQRAADIDDNLLAYLRSMMQEHKNLNYVLLGSQESMMKGIFQNKKSPFYHFGTEMTLDRIPESDFSQYLSKRLPEELAPEILDFTGCHPYYTQKLAFHIWNLLQEGVPEDKVVQKAIDFSNQMHSLDFSRMWDTFNNTKKKILKEMAATGKVSSQAIGISISTVKSALKKMSQDGILLEYKSHYEIEDPFFNRWILDNAF